MEKQQCLGGEMGPIVSSPMPVIGVYIAASTVVCFLLFSCDVLQGFRHKKVWFPCKFFALNSLTLSLLGIATKLPVDLTSSMPRVEDQLSKLSGPVLLTVSMGFFMPSLVDMEGFELFGNMAALTILVVTVMVNICIQLSTGVIFSFFLPEHVITMVLMLLTLVALWYISFFKEKVALQIARMVDRIELFLPKDINYWAKSEMFGSRYDRLYSLNPQYHTCKKIPGTVYIGVLCLLSLAVILEACARAFFLRHPEFCAGESDYKWSMSLIVGTQILMAVLGTLSMMGRSFFLGILSGSIESERSYDHEQFRISASLMLRLNGFSLNFSWMGIRKILSFLQAILVMVLFVTNVMMYLVEEVALFLSSLVRKHLSWKADGFEGVLQNGDRKHAQELKDNFIAEHPHKNLIHLLSNTRPYRGIEHLFFDSCGEGDKLLMLVIFVRVMSGVMPSHVTQTLVSALDEIFDMLYFISEFTPRGELGRNIAKEIWVTRDSSSHWFSKQVLRPSIKKVASGLSDLSDCVVEITHTLREIQLKILDDYHPTWKEYILVSSLKETSVQTSDILKETCVDIIYSILQQFPNIIEEYVAKFSYAESEKRAVIALKFMSKFELLHTHVEWLTEDDGAVEVEDCASPLSSKDGHERRLQDEIIQVEVDDSIVRTVVDYALPTPSEEDADKEISQAEANTAWPDKISDMV